LDEGRSTSLLPEAKYSLFYGELWCGREDSNLHEFYLTRSLVDQASSQSLNLLRKAASAEVVEGHEASNTGRVVPKEEGIVTMAEVREAARTLVRRVAEGGEIPTALLHQFANVVLRSELVEAANRLLDSSPTFAIRRAMELAGLVLTVGASQSAVVGSERGVADEAWPGKDS
jgi:hypothetical protein